ncbi:MAG TPA: 4Fe-4S dicluster domain-containing protein, partial [Methanothrix sp.]|nr:4Fe-4S dicluster domain-containing protein [Methanothrix sp.]
IIGRKIGNLFRWPALRLFADGDRCTGCGKCSTTCPMGLDVKDMIQQRRMEDAECILCGGCVDACPEGAIHYALWERGNSRMGR